MYVLAFIHLNRCGSRFFRFKNDKKKNEEKFSGLVNALVSNQAPSVLKIRFPTIYKLFWNYTPAHG